MTADTDAVFDASLHAALDDVARVAELIVASDFDGTLAPIAPVPSAARALPGALHALDTLAALPDTLAAVVSGRSLADLATLAPVDPSVELVGSHGLEFSSGTSFNLDTRAETRLRRLRDDIDALHARVPGSGTEHKPFSVTFHYRNAEPRAASAALREIERDIASRDGVFCKLGHMVVELFTLPASKSWAIDVIRSAHPTAAVVYIGDDLTDEDVFADLRAGDLGCKVGSGPTAARHRVAGPDDVVALLTRLAGTRTACATATG
jgi:trehalose 6-phosphate phosphatase